MNATTSVRLLVGIAALAAMTAGCSGLRAHHATQAPQQSSAPASSGPTSSVAGVASASAPATSTASSLPATSVPSTSTAVATPARTAPAAGADLAAIDSAIGGLDAATTQTDQELAAGESAQATDDNG